MGSQHAGVLGPGGALSRALAGFEDRPEQRAMAAAVAAAIEDRQPLIVEAGTGTGKTLAYLVPAILSGRRVIVSTGTRTLQEQICRHDIPLLRDRIGLDFTAVTLKGISNYVCRRRLREAGVQMQLQLTQEGEQDDLAVARAWASQTLTGDRAELQAIPDDAPVWRQITTTPQARIGSRCPHFERCFVTQARRAAGKADIVIVNHHLFFADLALRANYPGARVLPDYDAVVFDEAHQLVDVITEHFGITASRFAVAQLARHAREVDVSGVTGIGRRDPVLQTAADALERLALDLFARVRVRVAPLKNAETQRTELPPGLFAHSDVETAWHRLDSGLDELACHATLRAETDEEHGEELGVLARRAAALRNDIAELAEMSAAARFVYWGEVQAGDVVLRGSPIDVGPIVQEHLVQATGAVVFTSATLTSGGSFQFTRDSLGLEKGTADAVQVDSPFDYKAQAMLYLARDLPDPRDPRFGAACCARIAELIEITEGRTLVLFTSHRALRDAAGLLASLKYPMMVQGQAPRASLLDQFRSTPGGVLLATGAFWEGVDVPGDALSQVIIDKLPFSPPGDPLIAARLRRVEERGDNAFSSFQVPRAALALKQGVGRLIRRKDDRGIIAILDRRVLGKNYGRAFIASLPANLPRTAAIEQLRRWWTQ